MRIRIAQIGVKVKELSMNSGTLDETLKLAEVCTAGLEVWIKGKARDGDYVLEDGDIIVLIPENGIRGERTFKIGGDVWRIHKNDADEYFPSNFHAHNMVRAETLDLKTRNIYDSRTRQLIRKMSYKNHILLLQEIPPSLIK